MSYFEDIMSSKYDTDGGTKVHLKCCVRDCHNCEISPLAPWEKNPATNAAATPIDLYLVEGIFACRIFLDIWIFEFFFLATSGCWKGSVQNPFELPIFFWTAVGNGGGSTFLLDILSATDLLFPWLRPGLDGKRFILTLVSFFEMFFSLREGEIGSLPKRNGFSRV